MKLRLPFSGPLSVGEGHGGGGPVKNPFAWHGGEEVCEVKLTLKQRRHAHQIPQRGLARAGLKERLICLILQSDRESTVFEQPILEGFDVGLTRREMKLLPLSGFAQCSCSSLLSR
jgi:hypothetical protein